MTLFQAWQLVDTSEEDTCEIQSSSLPPNSIPEREGSIFINTLCTMVLIFDTLINFKITISMKADTGSISPIISETIILFEGCFFSAA